MNDKPLTDPESLPDSPKPQFLEGDGPLRLEDCFCVLRQHLGEEPDTDTEQVPDDKTNA